MFISALRMKLCGSIERGYWICIIYN